MSAFKNLTARLRELRSEWIGDPSDDAADRPPVTRTEDPSRPTDARLDAWPDPAAEPRPATPTARPDVHVDLDFPESTPVVRDPDRPVGAVLLLATLPSVLRQNLSDTIDHCGRLLLDADLQDAQVVRDSRAKEQTATTRREVAQWTHFVWGALVAQHALLLDQPGHVPHPRLPRTSGPRALTAALIEHARQHHTRQAERGRTAPWTLDPTAYIVWDEETDEEADERHDRAGDSTWR